MTRYEQGFLTKCAELGVPEKLAGALLKKAQVSPDAPTERGRDASTIFGAYAGLVPYLRNLPAMARYMNGQIASEMAKPGATAIGSALRVGIPSSIGAGAAMVPPMAAGAATAVAGYGAGKGVRQIPVNAQKGTSIGDYLDDAGGWLGKKTYLLTHPSARKMWTIIQASLDIT